MSEIKQEIKSVLRNELRPLARPDVNEVYTVALQEEVLDNDNLIQELENVVHQFSKPRMEDNSKLAEAEREISKLKGIVASQDIDLKLKTDALDLQRNRNKRLSDSNKQLQRGIMRVEKKQNKCDHIERVHNEDGFVGVAVQSTIELKQIEVGLYKLECSQCGKKF